MDTVTVTVSADGSPIRCAAAAVQISGAGGRPAGPAQDGADPRVQHPGLHGLDHIVVGARLQADNDVHLVAPRGRHDDRQCLVDGPYAAAHLEPRHAGQHQIEDDDVRPEGPQPVHPLLAGPGGDDVMALPAQGQGDALAHGAVVFDQQYTWHGPSIGMPSARPENCYRLIIWKHSRSSVIDPL